MTKSAYFILAFLTATPLAAQESLLPTHMSKPGEIFGTAEFRYTSFDGTLSNRLFDIDFKETHFLVEARASFGLSRRLEIDGSFPFEMQGRAQGGDANVDFEDETDGLGDLTIEGNYLILQASEGTPQVVGGLTIVLPTGNDDVGVARIESGGSVVQEGDKGGIGDGVFKFGFQIGVEVPTESGRFYGLLRYVYPLGTHNAEDVEIDRADVFTALAGALLPLGGSSSVDLRWTLGARGDEVSDFDVTGEATEESHVSFQFESRFYFKTGPATTLFAGVGLGWVSDHAADKEGGTDIEDVYGWGLTFGVHVKLGGRELVDY